MNKTYKVVYNHHTQTYIAVQETAKSQGKVKSSTVVGKAAASARAPLGLTLMVSALMSISGQTWAACDTFSTAVNCGSGSSATGTNSTAIGERAKATTGQSVAVGSNTVVSGDQAIGMGNDVSVTGNSSIGIGGDDLDKIAATTAATKYNSLTGDSITSGVYVKTTASGGGSVALGVQSQATGDLSTAFGTKAKATGLTSVALGVGAQATMENSVALGAGSTTATSATAQTSTTIAGTNGSVTYTWAGGANILTGDQVSVGAVGFERQIKNVAAGAISAGSTDAINGSQLYGIAQELQNRADRQNYFHVNSTGAAATGNSTNLDYVNGVGGAAGTNAIAAGVNASSTNSNAIAMGTNTIAAADSTIAVGLNAKANTTYAEAIGANSNATGQGSLALGGRSIH